MIETSPMRGCRFGRARNLGAVATRFPTHLLAGNILLRLNHLQRAPVEDEEYFTLAPKSECAGAAREAVAELRKLVSGQQELVVSSRSRKA